MRRMTERAGRLRVRSTRGAGRAAGRCGSRLARWKEKGAQEWASDELGRGRVNEKEGGESGWAAKQRAKPGRGREKRARPDLELG